MRRFGMEKFNVYKDISARTGGEIYIGVVGPVRTGKSTFIKRFMELLVLPGMEDVHSKEQAMDELPQSSNGKTITTTEPKFIPREAAKIKLADGVSIRARMIDCVGYMVKGAVGHMEDEKERLVKTPWYDYEIPFTQAAETGTKKVITDHSTIGIVVTTDGSFGDLPRANYVEAEEKTITELKHLGKPFVIVLNCLKPYSEEARMLAYTMAEKYKIQVLPVNCEQLKKDDIYKILEGVLEEFPVAQIDFQIPKWLEILPKNHWMKMKMIEMAKNVLYQVTWMKDAGQFVVENLPEFVQEIRLRKKNLSDGKVSLEVITDQAYYYQVISDYAGMPIKGEYELFKTFIDLAQKKQEFEKIQEAMESVKYKGYGVVTPMRQEIQLEEPQVIRHSGKYGVRMKAMAPSIHLIKSDIETEIAPIVGSEQQANDLIAYIKASGAENRDNVWDANIFGKSVEQIVDDGIHAKINQMTEQCQQKLQDTLKKIINDSNGGVICIII